MDRKSRSSVVKKKKSNRGGRGAQRIGQTGRNIPRKEGVLGGGDADNLEDLKVLSDLEGRKFPWLLKVEEMERAGRQAVEEAEGGTR